MKNIIIQQTKLIFSLAILFSISVNLNAQIRGNGNIGTFSQELGDFDKLTIDLPARIIINCDASAGIEIRIDENLVDYISLESEDGVLNLTQKEWIKPSSSIQILMGARDLRTLETSGYNDIIVENIQTDLFRVQALSGNVILIGEVEKLRLGTETGYIDASRLAATEVFADVWGEGVADVHPIKLLDARIAQGKLIYHKNPHKLNTRVKNNGKVFSIDELKKQPILSQAEPRYINVSFRNNGREKIDVFVKGPSNRRFSYGIPFKSQQVRNERFPVGTKIYKEGPIGNRRLLLTVEEGFENRTIDLLE